MALQLRKQGVESIFFALSDGDICEVLAENRFPILVSAITSRIKMSEISARSLKGLFRLMKDNIDWRAEILSWEEATQADWIHVRINALLPLSGLLSSALRIPVYWHLPNTINSRLPLGIQPIGMQVLCKILRIRPLGNSIHTCKSLGKLFVSPRVLYLGVNEADFSPEVNDPRLGETGEIRIGIFARLSESKAQDRVIEAVKSLKDYNYDIKLIIAGGPLDSPYGKKLKAQIEDSGLSDKISLIGEVRDVKKEISNVDFIINSRNGPEPFGFSIIEGMLMGRPVLAYAEGGPRETIVDGHTGWLIEGCSANDYAAGITRAIDDRPRWEKMSAQARTHAISKFTVSTCVDNYLAILRSDKVIMKKD